MSVSVICAATPSHFTTAARLIAAYRDFLDAHDLHDCSTGSIGEEIADLSKRYKVEKGGVLVAYKGQDAAGVIAVEELAPGIAELRRLFVADAYRGHGVGKALMQAAVQRARECGYARVRLDTFRSKPQGQNLYKKLGFYEIPPYSDLPPERVIFMEYMV